VMAFDTPARMTANFNFFQTSVLVEALLGLLFFSLACFIVPRTWHDKTQTASGARRGVSWEILKFGSAVRRKELRLRLLGINPFCWLTSRDRLKRWLVWAFLGVIALIWAWALAFYPGDVRDPSAYVWTGLIAHTVLRFWVAAEACRRFCLDRQNGALELLLSTPLPIEEVLNGQIISLRRQFAAPVAVVVAADLIFLAASYDTEATVTWLAGIVMLIADLITLGWVSMWLGLNSRNTIRAAAVAIARILFLPWLAFLILLTVIALFHAFFNQYMPRGL